MHHARRIVKAKRLAGLLVVVAAVAGGLFALHRHQEHRQAGTLLARASEAAAARDWDTAADLYQNYLNFRPNDVPAVAGYADALAELASTDPAFQPRMEKVTERLVQLDPDRLDARETLVKIHLEAGRYANARDHLTYLLSPTEGGRQDDAGLLELAAACEARDGRNFTKAVGFLDRAVATGRATTDAYLRLALTLHTEIATDEARERAGKVVNDLISARPNDIDARLARSRFRVQTGDQARAREDIEYAASLPGGAGDPDVILARADMAVWSNDLPAAKAVLTRGAADAPHDLRLRLRLADVLQRLDEIDEARTVLAESPPAASVSDITALEIADRLLDLGDSSAAAALADRMAGDARYAYIADYLRGRVELAAGNWPAALARFQKAVVQLPRLPAYHLNARLGVGQCYALAGNPDQQLAAFDIATQLSPGSVPAQLGRADALAKLGQSAAAIQIYRGMTASVPGARAPLCRLRLAEQLARSPESRDWSTLQDAYGPAPYPPEIELVRSTALHHQGKTDEAVAVLTEAVRKTPGDARLPAALAVVRGESEPDAGLDAIAEAAGRLGDQLPLRLAKAQLLARKPKAKATELTALAENVGGYGQSDRQQLWTGLAGLLAALGHRPEAIGLYERALAEAPFDVPGRVATFDLALMENRPELMDRMTAELGGIVGPDGASRLVVEAARGVSTLAPGDKPAIAGLREKLERARTQRGSWGRIYVLLGDLDMLDSQPDAALQNYRLALARGERTDLLVRKLVALLLDRQHHPEALAVLSSIDREAVLAPDLAKQLTLLKSVMGEDPEQNLDWARAAETVGSRDYRDQLFRATVLAVNNAPAEAKDALRKAVALNDSAPETWIALVRFLAANGDRDKARTVYEQAATKLRPADGKPTPAVVPLSLGACLELLGDAAGAEKQYREALTLAPADPAVVRQLVLLLQRTSRPAEAAKLLEATVRGPHPPAVKRWARRMLAFSMVAGDDGFAHVPAAVALIDENLRDGGNLLDDRRARALVQAVDPFQRTEAITGLTESAQAIPLGPEENYLLAKLYLLNGSLDRAETALATATKSGGLAAPEHLALLAKVQLDRGDTAAARQTIDRLKLAAPGSWTATAEEVRYLAKSGEKEAAGELAFSAAGPDEATHLLARVGPLLEQVDCPAEAEKAYRQYAGLVTDANAHVPLASFYLRHGRPAEAIALAKSREAECPVGTTARLLSGAVRSRPPALVSAAEKPAWDKTVTTAAAWVDDKLGSEPGNPDLLFAKAEIDDAAGRFDDELRAYEQALTRVPDSDVYLNNLALLLALHRRDESGRPLDLINRAINLRGPQPYFLDTRAVVHTVAGRLDLAAKDLDVAISLSPRPVYFFHMAMVHDRADRPVPRDAAVGAAVQRGLTKAMLHPKEWADYDRLVGKAGR